MILVTVGSIPNQARTQAMEDLNLPCHSILSSIPLKRCSIVRSTITNLLVPCFQYSYSKLAEEEGVRLRILKGRGRIDKLPARLETAAIDLGGDSYDDELLLYLDDFL